MKTGELYLEQVFIGAFVLAAFALPWLPEISKAITETEGLHSVVTGSLALGLAFLIGVPFDRFADTLLERLERHNRLRAALRTAADKKLELSGDRRKLAVDYFPEDQLRLAALRDSPAVVAWIDYHRSRVRLTRALAVYGPGLLLAGTVGSLRYSVQPYEMFPAAVLFGIVVLYGAWAALADRMPELPRSDSARFIDYALEHGWIDGRLGKVKRYDRGRAAKTGIKSDVAIWRSEWLPLSMPLALLALALGVALRHACESWAAGFAAAAAPLGLALAGIAAVVFSAWSWWRISATYRSYLLTIARYPQQSG